MATRRTYIFHNATHEGSVMASTRRRILAVAFVILLSAMTAAGAVGSYAFSANAFAQGRAAETSVMEVSSVRHVIDRSGVMQVVGRSDFLVDRTNGRYRLTAYDTRGRTQREVSVLGLRKTQLLPLIQSATTRTAANPNDPLLREVDNELFGLQSSLQAGSAQLVGQVSGTSGVQVRVRIPSPDGDAFGTFDSTTGLTTSIETREGGRQEFTYERLRLLPTATVDDSRFHLEIPGTVGLQTYEDVTAIGSAGPVQGIYWLGPSFGTLELKTIQWIRTEPRMSSGPPSTSRVHAIYGRPVVVGDRVVEVVTEPLPSDSARKAGRVPQPGSITGNAPAQMELVIAAAVVRLVGRDPSEVQAMQAALLRRG